MDFPPNPNPDDYTHFPHNLDISEFQLSDFLVLDDGEVDSVRSDSASQSTESHGASGSTGPVPVNDPHMTAATTSTMKCKDQRVKRSNKVDGGTRVAFRTKSESEIMDDGFKWRKYGKKMVKNNPNPRNYYRCSTRGCHVKKRVEREREDPSYVITTYDGMHNHESPCILYLNQLPWTPHSS
uniref:WRKY transcription factor 29 n=1 Tax=Santalum album TaxID=35974 RepID=A0A650C2W1_SANAL|nr:WRKY transcription factor 29 [Santalum album]